MNTPVVSLKGCSVTRQGKKVLSGIDWRLHAGQHWSIRGENGAGKTTFFALVSGELWPDKGCERRYNLDGKSTSSPLRARECMVRLAPELQETYRRNKWNLAARTVVMTGLDQTPFLYAEPDEPDLQRVDGVMGHLGLESVAQKPFLNLSQGQQRAVLVARAMVSHPRVLILDEFLLGLDAKAKELVMRGLEQAVRRGAIMLCSSHRACDVPPWTTHELVLRRGRIKRQGRLLSMKTIGGCRGNQAERQGDHPMGPPENGPGDPLIELNGVSVRIRGQAILDDLTWRVRRGEHTLITGPNGAGKTSLLRLLRGDLKPYAGVGMRWPVLPSGADAWCRRQVIGYACPEHQAGLLDPRRTVDALLRQARELAERSPVFTSSPAKKTGQRATEVLGLEALRHTPYGTLSFGQKQRVVLARALVKRPHLLLLDEPLNGLDAGGRMVFIDLLWELAASGVTLVCASHEHAGLHRIFTNHVHIEKGRLATARFT